MKSMVVFALLSLMTAGCQSSSTAPPTVSPGQEFQLAYGKSVSIPLAGLTITFRALGEDSRCPEGVFCVWEGNARVVVAVSNTEESLNTAVDPKQISHRGYSIQLLRVNPYPVVDETHDAEDYVITLVVTKE